MWCLRLPSWLYKGLFNSWVCSAFLLWEARHKEVLHLGGCASCSNTVPQEGELSIKSAVYSEVSLANVKTVSVEGAFACQAWALRVQIPPQTFCRLAPSVSLLSPPAISFTHSFPFTLLHTLFWPLHRTHWPLTFLCTLRALSFCMCCSFLVTPTHLLFPRWTSSLPTSPPTHAPHSFPGSWAPSPSVPCRDLDLPLPRLSFAYNHALGASPPLDRESWHTADAQ